MIKKIIGTVSALAVSMSLFSCAGKKSDTEISKKESKIQSRVADFSEIYKDFFDYTFDGDYTITPFKDNEDTDREQAYRYYDISYVRKDGTKRNTLITMAEFNEWQSERYESEQRMNNDEINDFCLQEIAEVFKKEFIENIICNYLDIEYEEYKREYQTDEYKCWILLTNPFDSFRKESEFYEKGCRIIDSHIVPETGYKLSEVDLKTAANDKEFILTVIINIDKNSADVQSYVDKMNGIISDYFDYAGKPMNSKFIIETKDPDSGKIEIVFKRYFFMGEELSMEESNDFEFHKEIIQAYTS